MAVTHKHEVGRYEEHIVNVPVDDFELAEARLVFKKWYNNYVVIKPI